MTTDKLIVRASAGLPGIKVALDRCIAEAMYPRLSNDQLPESLFLHERIKRCDNLPGFRLIGLTDIFHLGKNW